MSAQGDIQHAFMWIRQVYTEAAALLDDAQSMAEQMGYRTSSGVATGYATMLRANELPFVYLAVLFFAPEASTEKEHEAGQRLFLAIDFHSHLRTGPHLLLGAVRYSSLAKVSRDQSVNRNLINETARLRGYNGYSFTTKEPADGTVTYVHTPVPKAKAYAGVDEVRHVEIPLTFVDSPEKLRRVLDAAHALLNGDEGLARTLVEESRAAAG